MNRSIDNSPFTVLIFEPEDIFQTVRDREAAVRGAFRDDPLGPEMHGEMRPIIIAVNERRPGGTEFFLPCSMLRYETPEHRKIDDHAIIESRTPKRSDASHLIKESLKLIDEDLLRFDTSALRNVGAWSSFAAQTFKSPLLMSKLLRDIVCLNAEQGICADGMDVEPD